MSRFRSYFPLVLIVAVLGLAVFSLFGGTGFSDIELLSRSLEKQKVTSTELENRVKELRLLVNGLQGDDRVLERFARDELSLSRSDEVVFFFDDLVDDKQEFQQPSERIPE